MSEKTYQINEVFYSIQGEGMRAGQASVFVRFSKCNMRCDLEPGPRSPGGFVCDTEFESGRRVTAKELLEWVDGEWRAAEPSERPEWIVLTGGEPALQLDLDLCQALRGAGWRLAVETNGSLALPMLPQAAAPQASKGSVPLAELLARYPLDWITVSPKVAEHGIRQRHAHEVKYVRGHGQEVPRTRVTALHQLISPAFAGMQEDPRAVAWCVELIKRNPEWRLCAQLHKLWGAR